MVKLQYLTLTTAIAIIGSSSINIFSANASVESNKVNLTQNNIHQVQFNQIAQNSSDSNQSSGTGDEMMDALQKRQEKLENLKELKILKNKYNQEKIKELKAENIHLQDLEELEILQGIVNDQDLNHDEIIKALKKENINIDSLEKLQTIQEIINTDNSSFNALSLDESDKLLSGTTAFRMLAIGIPATILVFLIATPFAKGTIEVFKSNYKKKFGKPSIPERSLTLYNEAWQQILSIGRKADRLNDDKFGNEEFKILINFKVDVSKGTESYKELNYKVELLKAAIVAQKSFLKLESTELRYRSRKQQEFYSYISEQLGDDIDKEAFAKKIKKKQAELLPLINTEEGREAIHSYAREINEISKYELGLKLLSLFKKYDLKDFSIIRDISKIVEGLQGADLLEPKRLILTVKEYYDIFEKVAPILEISKAESTPATYARILQIVGLVHRHGDSYRKFKELIRLLHKWEQPHETITMVREQYSDREYSLPPEFSQVIPGENTYNKYAEYLPNLS